jgi:hypothetical protein
MKSKRVFLIGGIILFLIIVACSKGKVPEAEENFEGGSFKTSLFSGGGGGSTGQIVSDPQMVINGKYSVYVKADPEKHVWWEFLYSDNKKIPLEKKATYNVVFKYKAAEQPKGEGFYYFLARTNKGGYSHDKNTIRWSDSQGTVGTKSVNITLDDFDDYYLIWGIHLNGALSIDDIKIKKM